MFLFYSTYLHNISILEHLFQLYFNLNNSFTLNTLGMEKSSKREYRQRIKCYVCSKEVDSDYKEKHIYLFHAERKSQVTFTSVLEKSQRTLAVLFGKPSTSTDKYPEETDSDSDLAQINGDYSEVSIYQVAKKISTEWA